MDRALKERIIGAVVLVVIAVLVVPVFLDGGPSDAEIVTQTVTLPGQEEQSRKQQTIVLERDREQPVPAGARRDAPADPSTAERSGSGDTPPVAAPAERSAPPAAAQAQPEPQAPAEKKEEATAPAKEEQQPTRVAQAGAEAAPAAADSESATGMWAVQLGSFSNSDNAQRLASELRTNGYAAFLSQLKTSDGSLHRVRVGPQKDRDSAEAVAKRLSGDGHDGQVVPHP